MKAGGADDHAGDQLAQDRGQLPAHQQLRQQPGRHKDDQEAAHIDQGFGHLELMGADLGAEANQLSFATQPPAIILDRKSVV